MVWTPATWDARHWRDDAACANEDTLLWFPVGFSGPALEQAAQAKQVCADCPVREPCLVFAVTTNQEYGIWGGLDELERHQVRRAWRASRRTTRMTRSA